MKKEDMLKFINFSGDKCLCLIRTNTLAGEDELRQKEQLKDYLDAGARLLIIKTEYTEDRENKQLIDEIHKIEDLEYLIFNDITSLGIDIYWILRLIESLDKEGVKLYSADIGMTLNEYNLSYIEFIRNFIQSKKRLSYERASIVKQRSDKTGFNFGRPKKKLDHNILTSTIKQYEAGILTGKTAATKLGISESTFRKRLSEYRKKRDL